MATRALSSDERRLTWAVRLAQADLTTWRDGDWLNAGEELAGWLGGTQRGPRTPAAIQPRVRAVQDALRGLLHAVMDAHEQARRGVQTPPIRLRVDGYRTLALPGSGTGPLRVGFEARAPHADTALALEAALALADVLGRVDVGALRRCPECHRLFVRERESQRFDTTRCATRARVRAFMARRHPERRRRARPATPPPLEAPTAVVDLMEALRSSLAARPSAAPGGPLARKRPARTPR